MHISDMIKVDYQIRIYTFSNSENNFMLRQVGLSGGKTEAFLTIKLFLYGCTDVAQQLVFYCAVQFERCSKTKEDVKI